MGAHPAAIVDRPRRRGGRGEIAAQRGGRTAVRPRAGTRAAGHVGRAVRRAVRRQFRAGLSGQGRVQIPQLRRH